MPGCKGGKNRHIYRWLKKGRQNFWDEMKNFQGSLRQRSHEGNILVEMCIHEFFLKHALPIWPRADFSRFFTFWVSHFPRKDKVTPLKWDNLYCFIRSCPKLGVKTIQVSQVCEENSKKIVFKVLYNFEMQNSLPARSKLNTI